MRKDLFSQNELMELEALEVRGGTEIKDPVTQDECINGVVGCAIGSVQRKCANNVTACACTITYNCGNSADFRC